MKLFLDDIRDPPEGEWIVVRSYLDAIDYVTANGVPQICSFDHDLGIGPTGYDFVKYICEIDMDRDGTFIPKDFSFVVHSANPVGKNNIEQYLTNYLKYR